MTVDPTADNETEADETVILTVLGGAGYQVGTTGVAMGTILNDDGVPSVSIDDVSVTEGDSGTTPATFTVINVNVLSAIRNPHSAWVPLPSNQTSLVTP